MVKMRFVGIVDGHEDERVIDVDNHEADDGYYTMTIDGVPHTVDAQLMRSYIVSFLLDNRSYDVDLEKSGDLSDPLDGRLSVRVRGRVVRLNMLDERRHMMRQAAQAHLAGAAGAIESPMPGKVIKLLVDEGASVKRGDGVVVVEAMKMENELKAPADGVVSMIYVNEGEAVEAGQALLVVESA